MALDGLVAAAVLIRGRRVLLPAHEADGNPARVRTEDGIPLHTDTHGPGDASVTVVFAHGFAHGFASNAQKFHFQRQALERRARVVLVDQRGHGRSGWGSCRSATMDQLGRDLGEVIDQQVGKGSIVLVGHSMGGMAVLSLARQRPGLFEHRVLGVGLLSTASGHLTRTELPDLPARVTSRTGFVSVVAWSLWLLAPLTDRIAPFRRSWGRRWLLKKLFGENRPSDLLSTVQQTWARTQQSVP